MVYAHPADLAALTEPIQFIAPQSAVDAIDVASVVRQAADDGVTQARIDVSPFGTHAGWVQVRCPAEMALRLVSAWRDVAGKTMVDAFGEERLAVLRIAAVAAYRAFEDKRSKPAARQRR
jgi:hypothetical protein